MNIDHKIFLRVSPCAILVILVAFISITCVNGSGENEKLVQQENKRDKAITTEKVGSPPQISSSTTKRIILNRAQEVISTIKNKDMEKLSTFIHPDKGVRFSPYSFIDLETDLVFTSTQIKNILTDTTKYNWGYYDGSGADMRLKFSKYFEQFIYDQDFANAKEIGYQRIIGRGNMKNNNFEVYPQAIIVEYHFPGFNPKYEGMDWVSLRLVFEKKNNVWYLVGIIHDQWTS